MQDGGDFIHLENICTLTQLKKDGITIAKHTTNTMLQRQVSDLLRLDDYMVECNPREVQVGSLQKPATREALEKEVESLQVAAAIMKYFTNERQEKLLEDWSPLLEKKQWCEPLLLNESDEPDKGTTEALSFLVEGQCDYKALKAITVKDFPLVDNTEPADLHEPDSDLIEEDTIESSDNDYWGTRKRNRQIGLTIDVDSELDDVKEPKRRRTKLSKNVLPYSSISPLGSPTTVTAHHPRNSYGGKHRAFSYVELQVKCEEG